jgi:Cu-processing system permease protein
MHWPVLTIASFTLLEALRSRLLWLVFAVLLATFGLAEFIGSIALTESLALKSGMLGAGLRLFAVFMISLFVTTSMVRELNDKVLELILALPIPRAAYYFGKLLGFSLVALVTAVLIGLSLLLYVPPSSLLAWTTSLLCELFIIAALSLLCLFSLHQVTFALSMVAGFYLLSRSINAIQLMGQSPLIDADLSQHAIGTLVDIIAFLLPELHRFTPSRWLIYHTATWQELAPILGQTAVYLVLLIGAGLFDLYRKNL